MLDTVIAITKLWESSWSSKLETIRETVNEISQDYSKEESKRLHSFEGDSETESLLDSHSKLFKTGDEIIDN